MASLPFKFMLGLYPKTEAIEKNYSALTSEYKEFLEFSKSEKLARYEHLNQVTNSKEFADKKQYFIHLVYKGSPEEQKETTYLAQKKSADVKFYYSYGKSSNYGLFTRMDGSSTIADYEKLKAFIESAEFKKVEDYMNDKKKFEKTQEFQKFQEYHALATNQSFINYFKFLKSHGNSDFQRLYKSSTIVEFETLEKYIRSTEFMSLQSSMKSKEFKASEAYQKFSLYTKQKKSSEIRNYYKLLSSNLITDYKKIHGSEELKYYTELEAFVKSSAFTAKKKEIESLRFENTDEYRKQQDFKRQSGSSDIKGYYKIKASKELSNYKRIDSSGIIAEFETLEKYILSDEFKNRKNYLQDTKKWEKSDEFKLLAEFDILKKDPKIIWYFKSKASPKFDELKAWNLVFEDNFDSGKIDRSKWITRYFWGEVLLNDTYALPGEKHIFTDGKNIQINGSTVKVETKKEKVSGKEWNPMLGFYPREFEYTSGILNTGSSFRTQYGKIEAKIKLKSSKGVVHAFWLAGETMVPQIDVFKCFDNKLYMSTYWGNPAEAESVKHDTTFVSASHFTEKYFIYSIEWSADSITWKINGQEIKKQQSNIPAKEMYIAINSGVLSDDADVYAANYEIDWIRCFQKV